MKRLLVALHLVTAGALLGAPMTRHDSADLAAPSQGAVVQVHADQEFAPGQILVGFHPHAGLDDRQAVLQGLGATPLRAWVKIEAEHWSLPETLPVQAAIEALSKNPNVRYAEPNYVVRTTDTTPPPIKLPNDALRNELWGLHNAGQTGGTLGVDIGAFLAWTVTEGSEAIVVAVIDTGIDYYHPDLQDNILRDASGKPVGYDFHNRNDDPRDDHGHGTHVAGTIAAAANELGVVGVAPNVKLVPVKFLDAWGSGYLADAIDAIQYVANLKDEGIQVRISNNSWGGRDFSQALYDAIEVCGQLFVASAGNSGGDGLQYPAGYDLPNVIAVAATDHRDELASFSTFGEWVHIAAPGVSILSTVLDAMYDYYDGTSMAAPHVSGAAALVLSRWVDEGGLDLAEMTDQQVEGLKAHLIETAQVVPNLKIAGDKRLNVAAALGLSVDRPFPEETLSPFTLLEGTEITLAADDVYQNAVTLRWNYPADEPIYAYDIRHRAHTSIDGTWPSGTPVRRIPRPRNDSGAEQFQVRDLSAGTEYSLQMRALDPWGNTSPLSTVVDITTPPAEWLLHAVGENAGLFKYAAVAVHGANVHVAYFDETDTSNRTVRHVWFDGNEWRSELVAPGMGGLSMAIDPNGHPAISFVNWVSSRVGSQLHFATKASGKWVVTNLDKLVRVDATSLAYHHGRPVISYGLTDGGKSGLKLAWQQAKGRWVSTLLHSCEPGPRYNSLAFNPDGSGEFFVAYCYDEDMDNWIDSLFVVRGQKAGDTVTVTKPHFKVRGGAVGHGVFCALDYVEGQPAIVHSVSGVGDKILYEYRVGAENWEQDEIAFGRYANLTTHNGNAYVAYLEGSAVALASGTPGQWTHETVEDRIPPWPPALAVPRAGGKPLVAFSDSATAKVHLAAHEPGYPGPETLVYWDMEPYTEDGSGTWGSAGDPWTSEGASTDREPDPEQPLPDNLWHLTERRADTPGHSARKSFYYGLEDQGNYHTGRPNWGRLISPEIDLTRPDWIRAELYLSQFVRVPWGSGPNDAILQISSDQGQSWQELFRRPEPSPGADFVTDRLDLSEHLGRTIRIGFYLDTENEPSNDYEGWYVDDVVVRGYPYPDRPPIADFSYQVDGLTVQFTDQSASFDGGGITSWYWEFGDGHTSTGQHPGHTYTEFGTYTVTLTVTDAIGSDTTSKEITLSDSEPPGEGTMVAALAGSSYWLNVNFWKARVTITVTDAVSGSGIAGAIVTGAWSGGFSGAVSTITGADGTVTVETGNIRANQATVTFTVTDVQYDGYTFAGPVSGVLLQPK
jgi:subtilisin family serine protease/PKD repeat protein